VTPRAFAIAIAAAFATVVVGGRACTAHAAPDDNISLRAVTKINRAFTSPGSGLTAVYLATSGGRISLMGDSDNALMAWLVRQDGAQVVVTIVKETR
jgi:hypothetical protein